MSPEDFIQQFKDLGFEVNEPRASFIAFAYAVPVGKFAGTSIKLAIQIDGSPVNPPPGPHVSPRLLPINTGADLPHPRGGVHESPLGPEWQYWSRPFKGWAKTDRSARVYLAHVNNLFATQ